MQKRLTDAGVILGTDSREPKEAYIRWGVHPPQKGHVRGHTHTHTQPFNGPFSGTTQVSRYQ